jgi:hypothetical protein
VPIVVEPGTNGYLCHLHDKDVAMSTTKHPGPEPGTPPQKPVIDKAALQRRLQTYYQLECVRPTSQRLQLFLDEFLRKASVSPDLDRRAESAGDH